jgi:hypothetical protein
LKKLRKSVNKIIFKLKIILVKNGDWGFGDWGLGKNQNPKAYFIKN